MNYNANDNAWGKDLSVYFQIGQYLAGKYVVLTSIIVQTDDVYLNNQLKGESKRVLCAI